MYPDNWLQFRCDSLLLLRLLLREIQPLRRADLPLSLEGVVHGVAAWSGEALHAGRVELDPEIDSTSTRRVERDSHIRPALRYARAADGGAVRTKGVAPRGEREVVVVKVARRNLLVDREGVAPSGSCEFYPVEEHTRGDRVDVAFPDIVQERIQRICGTAGEIAAGRLGRRNLAERAQIFSRTFSAVS